MAYYDTTATYYRRELGIDFACYVKRGGYTETVARGGYSDAPWVFDHTACDESTTRKELRKHLRRQARWAVKR